MPLSRRQRTVLTLIIACVFQFVLFFTPVLAAEAVTLAQGDIKMDATQKSEVDPVVASLIENNLSTSLPEAAEEEILEEDNTE
ncbi:hypothetical protein EOM81_12965, partial [bacterium]|nr:hypothetical protein [bacterium]